MKTGLLHFKLLEMKSFKILSFFLIQPFLPFTLAAQGNSNQVVVLDYTVNPGASIDEINLPPARLDGSFYLNDEWQTGSVYLTHNQVLKGFSLKYDVEHQLLEIKTSTEIKVCEPENFQKFEWINKSGHSEVFLSGALLKNAGQESVGKVFQILIEGRASLLKQTEMVVIKSTYVPTVDVGQRNDRVRKKEKYFLLKEGKLFRIKNRKSDSLTLLQECKGFKKYLKEVRPRLNKEDDLIKMITAYNHCSQNQ